MAAASRSSHQLRQSVGLQRGMLIAGLVITGTSSCSTAVFAPVPRPVRLSPSCATPTEAFGAQQPPSAEHLLGTTVGGYDVLSARDLGHPDGRPRDHRRRACSRSSRACCSGLSPGYFGGWLDRVLVVIADAVYAFPTLLLGDRGGDRDQRRPVELLGRHFAAAISITVVFIPQYFRVIRAEMVRIKSEAYRRVGAQVIGTQHAAHHGAPRPPQRDADPRR